MAAGEAELVTTSRTDHTNWTAAGSDASAQKTYTSIKAALKNLQSQRNVEIFLQGSYANATNIRADSDVDVVVMTKVTFRGSTTRLGPTQKARYEALPASSYQISDLRSEVHAALTAYYGSARVHSKNKCIKVDKRDGYVDADVVPCIQYRWYPYSDSDIYHDFVEGISIKPLAGQPITNFPKQHIANGHTKNNACSGNYKKTVRQLKRLRNRAVDEGRLDRGLSPGYLLECMTFNAPADRFVTNDTDRLEEVLLWLKFANKPAFVSCDEIHKLFIDDPGDFAPSRGQVIADALWETF